MKFKPVAFQEFEEAKIYKILIQTTMIYNYSYSIITFYFYTNLNGDINFASKLKWEIFPSTSIWKIKSNSSMRRFWFIEKHAISIIL